MSLRRTWRFGAAVLLALATVRCTLFVDTSNLATTRVPTEVEDSGRADGAGATSSDHEPTDSGSVEPAPSRTFPEGSTPWSGNGNAYRVVTKSTSITWEAARSEAEKVLNGHLATVKDQDENEFLMSLILESAAAQERHAVWLGGRQDADAGLDASAGWSWVNGDPWWDGGWGDGEPNDMNGGGVEDSLCATFHSGASLPWWADCAPDADVRGYVVEFEANP